MITAYTAVAQLEEELSMERRNFLQNLGSGLALPLMARVIGATPVTDELIRPQALKAGDTVGLITPATYVPDPDRLQWKITYNKPLIISEFGGDALFGYHGDAGVRWTEEYQKNLYEHQLGMLKKIPSLRGMTPWILTDFRSPRRPLPHIQDFYNRKGLISSRGERKEAFYTLQNFYRDLVKERAGP